MARALFRAGAGEAATAAADALGMADGDGSLAVVASMAAAHPIPFVCVPVGTRGHFALDVGVDHHDVTGTLDAFAGGVERRIDTAEVNGRMFLNNVSLGIYGDAVRSPAYRDAKLRALLETAAEVMGPSAGELVLDLTDDLGHEHRQPAVVFVSNNPYALDRPLARGTRPALDSCQLGIVVLDAPGDNPRVPGRAWSAPPARQAGDQLRLLRRRPAGVADRARPTSRLSVPASPGREAGTERQRAVPAFTAVRSAGQASGSAPAASPRLRRSLSPPASDLLRSET